MTKERLFTILLPVNRPPNLLPFAVESVLAQSEGNFELFIICDGAPKETVGAAEALAARDSRIRVFAFAKGERHGEAHRHTALGQAASRFVAQIGDDDLWFPDYLAELALLLEKVDFGNLLQTELALDGAVLTNPGDLAMADVRRRMCTSLWNFFGPSNAGYRLSAYRRLPVGWSPAPPDIFSDLYMWRKLLERTDLSFGTRFSVQSVKLSALDRSHMAEDARMAENRAMAARFANPAERRTYQARVFHALFGALYASERDVPPPIARSPSTVG